MSTESLGQRTTRSRPVSSASGKRLHCLTPITAPAPNRAYHALQGRAILPSPQTQYSRRCHMHRKLTNISIVAAPTRWARAPPAASQLLAAYCCGLWYHFGMKLAPGAVKHPDSYRPKELKTLCFEQEAKNSDPRLGTTTRKP